MDKYFRTEQNKIVNIIEHTLQEIDKWSNLKIYLGTDSQDYGKITRYVTAIVYRYGKRGAHYIYFKEEVDKLRDMYTRLYAEGSRTKEVAQMIDSEIPISFAALEFDYNQIPKWASNKLIFSIGGWARGLNYNAVFKNEGDNMMIATKAADHICRR